MISLIHNFSINKPVGKLFPESGGDRPSILKGPMAAVGKGRPNNGSSKENLVSPGSAAPVRHVIFQRESSVDAVPLRRTSVTRQTSMQDSLMSPQSDVNAGDGPFNFRQRLRKTEFAPTDTLKKMKERSSQSVDE